jgi:hypothetical protein
VESTAWENRDTRPGSAGWCGNLRSLQLSAESRRLIVFVHRSGSNRFSVRNKYVAEQLNQYGMSTLLLDLLTKEEQDVEEQTMRFGFDIQLLAQRTYFGGPMGQLKVWL